MFNIDIDIWKDSTDIQGSFKDITHIFKLPSIFRDLYTQLKTDDVNYLVLNGGRASTKTQSTATFLVEESYQYIEATFICGREYMSTIKDSVYDTLARLIKAPIKDRLIDDFKITDREIINIKTGTKFIFRGFNDFGIGATKRDSNLNKVKSISNIKYVWVDESQDLTLRTLDVLIPTGRGFIISFYDAENYGEVELDKNTKFIFTLNKNTDEDAVFEYFKVNSKCIFKTINLFDLPIEFQNKAMLDVAESDKLRGADYNHIWLGMAKSSVNNPMFKKEWLIDSDIIPINLEYIIIAVDPNAGGDDEAGIIIAGYLDDYFYLLGDYSTNIATEIWTQKVAELYHKYKANRVIYEKNQGGSFIKNVFNNVDYTIPLTEVVAKKAKHIRAEPLIPLFENKKIIFDKRQDFSKLKFQLLQFSNIDGFCGVKSPDRADACVYAITHLQEKFIKNSFKVEIW